MDATLKALAAPVRREILALVKDREQSAGQIAARFSLTRPAVSQHLAALKAAGLLDERRQGTSRLYRLRAEGLLPVRQLVEALAGPARGERRSDRMGSPRESARVVREVSLTVRPSLAFAFLRDADRLRRWWRSPERWEASPGGALRVDGLEGVFRAVEEPGALRFEVAGLRVDIALWPEGLGTRLTVAQEGPAQGAFSSRGWDHHLSRLQALARGWDPGPDDWDPLT